MDAMFAPLAPEETAATEQAPTTAAKTPIIPVPADAPPMRFKHPRLGEPSQAWPYHDAEGRLVGYVARWDFIGDDGEPAKDILPVTFCDLGKGKRAWRSKGMPSPRPLFALPDILARPDAPVMIVEGEKTRDAAAALFPDMVVTTPAHGAKSPHKTDFAPLAGRTVIIATDNDAPGETYGDKVCELARAAGAAEVLHLHPDRLGAWLYRDVEKALRGKAIPEGWDLADAVADGWTAERVAGMRSDPAFIVPYRDGSRIAARFGLVAAGGEMATAFGVLPWEPGEATKAAARCFADWLAARGGVEPAEERDAIATVRRFIELHGASRFEGMGDLASKDASGFSIDQRIVNRVGFRRRRDDGAIEYLILPEVWRSEVCAGFDPTMVARTLAARDMLIKGADGKPQLKVRLPGFERGALLRHLGRHFRRRCACRTRLRPCPTLPASPFSPSVWESLRHPAKTLFSLFPSRGNVGEH